MRRAELNQFLLHECEFQKMHYQGKLCTVLKEIKPFSHDIIYCTENYNFFFCISVAEEFSPKPFPKHYNSLHLALGCVCR